MPPLVLSAQPPVPPPRHHGHQVDVRAGQRRLGGHVAPRPEQQPVRDARRGKGGDRAEGVVAIAVGPASDEHGRADDAVVSRPQRPVPPVGRVALLLEPAQQPWLQVIDACPPGLHPLVADERGHGWQRVHGDHVRRIVDDVEQPERATHQMYVVGVSVVGGIDRDDGLELRRSLARDLQRVEAGVGRAVHADRPGAPRLVRQPGDDLAQVLLLLGGIFVDGEPVGRAGAAQVEARDGVPVLVAQPHIFRPVGRCEVVLAIGQCLEHAGGRQCCLRGEEEGDRQPCPVPERDHHAVRAVGVTRCVRRCVRRRDSRCLRHGAPPALARPRRRAGPPRCCRRDRTPSAPSAGW